MAEDSIWSRIGSKYTEQFDPTMVGLSLISTANNPNRAQNLGQALLLGRQARMDEAMQRAQAAAAKRKEQIEMTGKGMYETDAGFGRRRTVQTPTGVVLVEDTAPTGETSYSQVYAPPEKTAEPKDSWTISSTPVTLPDGRQVLYKINKYTGEMQEVGAPAVKPGGPGGAASGPKAEANRASNLQRYSTDLENFVSYFPVMDKSGRPVPPETLVKGGFDPRTMKVTESAPLATGALSGLPSLTDTAQDVDALRKKINSNEFIDNLLSAKASGATFGSLTEGEAAKLETFRSVIADPKTPPQRIIQEYIALQRYIDNEIAPKYQGGQQGPTLSPAAQRYFQ